ncbi:MAG: LEA type 2 family protein [Labilithrix sp.]|nr:LEA type 2 family protein [Labilithrix sp.]
MPRRTVRAAFCFLLLLFAALTAGCVSKPTMRLNRAEISGFRVAFPPSVGVVMTMVVDVYNPNSYDVAIRAMRGQVVLADRYTLPIDFRPGGEGVWLASKQTTTVRVPVTVPVDLALQLLRETYTQPTVPFRVIGKADVTASRTFRFEADDYSVDETGSVSRQQIEIALRGG